MDGFFFWLTLLTAVGSGLVGGALFAFSNLVLKGLRTVPTTTAMAAMQALNAAVDRSLFVAAFVGTGVASLALAVSAPLRWNGVGSAALLVGSLLYLSVIVVTRIVHLPRNAVLMTKDPAADESAAWWERFRSTWNTWNWVRTVAALLATVALVLALVL